MSVWSQLGKVISSYLNDYEEETAENLFSANRSSENSFFENKFSESKFSWQDIKLPPEWLRADFELLEVPFGADDETCKAAYKRLLKIHHPDRHAGHEGDFKKATEKTAKINAAHDRIEKWRQGK